MAIRTRPYRRSARRRVPSWRTRLDLIEKAREGSLLVNLDTVQQLLEKVPKKERKKRESDELDRPRGVPYQPHGRKMVQVPNYEEHRQRISSIMRALYELPEKTLGNLGKLGIVYSIQKIGSRTASLYFFPSNGLIASYTPAEAIVIAEGYPRSTDDYMWVNQNVLEENLRIFEELPSYVENMLKEYQKVK